MWLYCCIIHGNQKLLFFLIKWGSLVWKIFSCGKIQSSYTVFFINMLLVFFCFVLFFNYHILWAAATLVFVNTLALRYFSLHWLWLWASFSCGKLMMSERHLNLSRSFKVRSGDWHCLEKSFTLCCIGDHCNWPHLCLFLYHIKFLGIKELWL